MLGLDLNQFPLFTPQAQSVFLGQRVSLVFQEEEELMASQVCLEVLEVLELKVRQWTQFVSSGDTRPLTEHLLWFCRSKWIPWFGWT